MAFENGVVLFFRHMMADKSLARSIHPDARSVERAGAGDDDFIIYNESGDIVGIYPREWIAAILPLVPANQPAGAPIVTN
jgi:hypothetical protein